MPEAKNKNNSNNSIQMLDHMGQVLNKWVENFVVKFVYRLNKHSRRSKDLEYIVWCCG